MTETRLRCGRKVGRTLYEHAPDDPDGRLVGMVDSAELAAEIVRAVNARRDARAGVGFYEDDEPVRDVLAAWEQGVPRTTTAPGSVGVNARLDTSADEVARLQSRLRAAEARLTTSVTSHPHVLDGHATVGGTRVPADQVADLAAEVGEEHVPRYYPDVTPAGVRAARAFARLYAPRQEAEPSTDPGEAP